MTMIPESMDLSLVSTAELTKELTRRYDIGVVLLTRIHTRHADGSASSYEIYPSSWGGLFGIIGLLRAGLVDLERQSARYFDENAPKVPE